METSKFVGWISGGVSQFDSGGLIPGRAYDSGMGNILLIVAMFAVVTLALIIVIWRFT